MLDIIPMVMWHSELFYISNKQIKNSRGHTKRKEEDTFGVLLG